MPYSSATKNRNAIRAILMLISLLACLLMGCVQRQVSGKAVVDNLVLELQVSDRCPNYGETVTIRATVTNRDSRPFIVELKDRPLLDISIGYSYSTPSETLIRWSDGKPLTSELTRLELEPGESKSVEMAWVVPTGIGFAGVSATVYYDDRSLDNSIGVNLSLTPANCIGH